MGNGVHVESADLIQFSKIIAELKGDGLGTIMMGLDQGL